MSTQIKERMKQCGITKLRSILYFQALIRNIDKYITYKYYLILIIFLSQFAQIPQKLIFSHLSMYQSKDNLGPPVTITQYLISPSSHISAHTYSFLIISNLNNLLFQSSQFQIQITSNYQIQDSYILMHANKIDILRLVARKKPPLIGVAYQNKTGDQKKKVFTILLQNLIFNPNIEEVVNQLYRQHSHILVEDKIPKEKVAKLIAQIQEDLNEEQQYEYEHDEFEHAEQQQEDRHGFNLNKRPPQDVQQQDDYDFDDEDEGNPQLNRSM